MVGVEEDDDSGDPILGGLSSETTMNNVNQVVQNKLSDYHSSIEQNISAEQRVVIDCGSDKLTPWHVKSRNERYTWYGAKVPNSGCPQFGCCYDVTQQAQVKLVAINQTDVENHVEMLNTVTQELEQNVRAVVGDSDEAISAFTRSTNSVHNANIQKITTIMEQASKTDVSHEQVIEIKSFSPLRCVNKCNEPPSAGKINQFLNIEIISQNITNDVTKTIIENYVEMNNITETEVTNIDMKKIYLFATFTVLIFIAVYILSYIISRVLITILLKKPSPPSIMVHIGAILIFIWIYKAYLAIVCILKKWPASMVPIVWVWCFITG